MDEAVRAAANGDADAQRELFDTFREVAYATAYRITGRVEDALDVVQDAFIRAFERLGDFQGASAFKTWLLRIVSNRALDLLRARKVRLAVSLSEPNDGDADGAAPEPAAGGERPGDRVERSELADQLAAALERLSPEQRVVFSLFATQELTYGEIAEALGIPIGTVMSRLFHARAKLKAALAEAGIAG